ncbi:MAG: NmrA family transcriptional regulator [Flexibacter sp. CG_4_10_14_3_um_filter_32_15]|nr:MAG: NmrA family transcriptional regulator [Flexibacter sp. CG_4_10_14_3_um_filter_32_15]
MENILITGATGNIGREILHFFILNPSQKLFIATRQIDSTKENEVFFDFENIDKTIQSIKETQINTIFLLRPPQIADTDKYFKPLIEKLEATSVKHIVFLSVQGAEEISFIPHAKIEKLLKESAEKGKQKGVMSYTFIRPSYFMQNLTTTLKKDLEETNKIYLPAGKAKFLWIDAQDIGKAIASVLSNTENHKNKAYTITGTESELLNFEEVTKILTEELHKQFVYKSPNLISFFIKKKKEGEKTAFIFVLIMLHFAPRFQKPPKISDDFEKLTGEKPNSLREFIKREMNEQN